MLTQETTKGVSQDLGFRDVVNQHQYTTIFTTLIIKYFPIDRAVSSRPLTVRRRCFRQGNTAMTFDLLANSLRGRPAQPAKTSSTVLPASSRQEATEAFQSTVDFQDTVGVFIRHQESTGHVLKNTLVKILQSLKLFTHLDEVGF